jgi:hypothetical protein
MPGKRITAQQGKIYMELREEGKTQMVAAAKAGISKRSGERIDNNGGLKKPKEHTWNMQEQHPLNDIWESEAVPLLKRGVTIATFLLKELQKRFPDKITKSMTRSVQRRVKEWKALHGEKEVMFLQKHEPGKLGISDFTHPKDIVVTIKGEIFEHIFYHFRLPFSGFSFVIPFPGTGESFVNFAQGLQEALDWLGGAPEVHRTDSLSASFKNLNKQASEDLTERYTALSEHYAMRPTRINKGKAHENGGVECPHRHIKDQIRHSLIVRDSIDFDTFEEYCDFIKEVVKEHNMTKADRIALEKESLNPLPATALSTHDEQVAVVSCSSTINVRNVTYTVPSGLIGQTLRIKFYRDTLECYLGSKHACSLGRVYASRGQRGRNINYRHIIGSLIKKPGAFRGSVLRDDILPDDKYRFIWEHVDRTMENSSACKFIVGLLYLAATEDCQDELADKVIGLIKENKALNLRQLQDAFMQKRSQIPSVAVSQHTLNSYNDFIPNHQGAY